MFCRNWLADWSNREGHFNPKCPGEHCNYRLLPLDISRCGLRFFYKRDGKAQGNKHTLDGRIPANQLRLVVYSIYRVVWIPGGERRISSINSIEQSSLLGVAAGLWRDPPRAPRPLRDTAPCVASATGPDDDDTDTFSFPSCFTRWVGILPKNIHGNWKIDHWKRKFKNYLLDIGSFEWV